MVHHAVPITLEEKVSMQRPFEYAVLCEHYHCWPNKHRGNMHDSTDGKRRK